METNQLQALIKKYNAGNCTPEEKLWLEQWYLSFEWSADEDLPEGLLAKLKKDAWKTLQQAKSSVSPVPLYSGQQRSNRRRNWWYYGAAATVITAASLLFIQQEKRKGTNITSSVSHTKPAHDIMPGTSKASLVLDNGSVIALDAAAITQLKEADGTVIDKQYGKIVYNNASQANEKIFYNTLNIPRGAEYQLVLPDGSRVWLNAASSLRFPTRFAGNNRTVYLDGEAYFEIEKNTKQPFKVVTRAGMEVNVTGTHFNIMAYEDEAYIKTTLTEGKVKVKNGITVTPLVPSQQAALQKNTQQLKVKEVDIDKEIAWKNGMIEFSDDDLPYIMRQLSRWYNVEVNFEGNAPKGQYNGSIPRKATLTEVMQILKLAGVKYWLDNNRVVITGG